MTVENTVPAAAAAQPYLGTDVVAFVLALLAILYALLWRRDGERGTGWYAISMALLAVWAATNRQHLPSGPFLVTSPLFYLMCGAMASLAYGLVEYLGIRGLERRLGLCFTLGPALTYLLLVAAAASSHIQVPRLWANLLVAICFAAMGALAWRARLKEPGAGHGFIAWALWCVPMFSVGLVVARIDAVSLRYWAVLPVIVVALTLLTVTLLRRRRQLEVEIDERRKAEARLSLLNASLEKMVASRTSELEDLVAGLESFNHSVSHDLRGPLGGIASLASLAREALLRGDTAPAARALPLIAEQAAQSTQLVGALLSLARAGKDSVQRELVDLNGLVAGIVEQLGLEQPPGAAPEITVEPMTPVRADPELIRSVFTNLIGNAVKFARGDQRGRVRVWSEPAEGEVVIHVQDNGVGFDTHAAQSLFTPFTRLHGETFKGHGIGLSIVRRVVERHGGRVWADGRPGQGAVFHFTLPH